MHPEVAEVLVSQKFTDEEIYDLSKQASVELAGGDTNTESVCDFDSGTSQEKSGKRAEAPTVTFGNQRRFHTRMSVSGENTFL